jgi:hypothetical protein
MYRIVILSCVFQAFVAGAFAQSPPQRLPADLQTLPDELKNLKWQTIDMGSVPTLEHCRALLLMNHTLDELSANATAEADLLSTYIEKQNLGSQFANTPPPPPPPLLTYPDAEKISVALLRGPMSSSYYATELGAASPGGLAAYAETYERTCQRRWAEFDEGRHLVRSMTSFLGNNQKLPDYEAWATAEVALRQKQYEQRPGATPPAGQMPAGQGQSNAQLAQQNQQVNQALAVAEAQQVSQAPMQAAPGQPQAAPAQQQQQQLQTGGCAGGYVAAPVYAGYGGYGAYGATPSQAAAAGAYAGATAANNSNSNKTNVSPAAAAAAGQYHGANSTYNHDSAYNSAARSQTEQRMNNFHGTGTAGRR